MVEVDVGLRYFSHLMEHQLAICKECKYAVRPDQIERHLQQQHRRGYREAILVGEAVRSWPGLIRYPGQLSLPSDIVERFKELSVYPDGLLCRLEPSNCRYIARNIRVIKRHWRENHEGWSTAGKRGQPSQILKRTVRARVQEGCRQVHCQRFFPSRYRSQYFEVKQPESGFRPELASVPVGNEAAWTQLGQKMTQAWAKIEENAKKTIQGGERDEVNPWLERTGWLPYLMGLERADLLASIEEPNSDPKKEEEPVEAAIWEAMDGLARFSQDSVISKVGVFVKLEAIRTEKHQTRYQPLQPYMDEESIVKHCRPWKQILMFFARTQRRHERESPEYEFTARQEDAWERLVEEARKKAAGEEDTETDKDTESEDEMETDEETAIEEETVAIEEGEKRKEEVKLTRIQKACLEFCIELLDQAITQKEYDSPLVCALAVLGVREDGWKGVEQYPPILSAVIKVARFLVVQQALELSAQEEKGCLQFVREMMDRFMVRGSHGPIQWILDLRTYGLKVHYNTTARGHVEWMGEELLYKELHFSMTQFRSMIHGLVTESKKLLSEELLFCKRDQVPAIPWDKLRDNPTDGRPGWNFTQDHRTRFPVEGRSWLFDRIGQEDARKKQFLTRDGGFNKDGVELYMQQVIEFREKLIILIHITGGQPARGPEILSIRHSNTIKGGHRNIFVEDGLMVFVTRYHKGYAVSGDIKIIHRYLPREVGELLVWYLWLVLPFQQQLEAVVWGKEEISSHLWPADPDGKKWTTERIRKVLT